MAAGIKPLTKRPTWKALRAHYKKVRELQLRKFSADGAKRGERWYTCVRNRRQSPLPLCQRGERAARGICDSSTCARILCSSI